MKKVFFYFSFLWCFLFLFVIFYNGYQLRNNFLTAKKTFNLLTPSIARLSLYQTQYLNQDLSGLPTYKTYLNMQANSKDSKLVEFIQSLNATENRPENFSLAYLELNELKANFNNAIQEQAGLVFKHKAMPEISITTDVEYKGPILTEWDDEVRKVYGTAFDNYHIKNHTSLGGSYDNTAYKSSFNYKDYTVMYLVTFKVNIQLVGNYLFLPNTNVTGIDSTVNHNILTYSIPYMLFN